MAGLGFPNDTRIAPGAPSFGDVWIKLFGAIVRKLNAGAAVTTVTTADAVDATTTQDLVNELKAKVNELSAAMNA